MSTIQTFKPDLITIPKDYKYMFGNVFLSYTDMAFFSSLLQISSFTKNICNQYDESFKIPFGASSQTSYAMVTTIWRPGFTGKFSDG